MKRIKELIKYIIVLPIALIILVIYPLLILLDPDRFNVLSISVEKKTND